METDVDQDSDEPPCLQRIWGRITENENEGKFLNMNTHWRSRDAYKAALMNIDGFVELQKKLAGMCSEEIGEEVKPGRYVDISDSFHIYGSYFDEFENRFLNLLEERDFEDRVLYMDDKAIKRGIERGREEKAKERVEDEKINRIKKVWDRI